MDQTTLNAFDHYRRFLWILGVWPLEEKSAFRTCRFVVAAIVQASFLLHTATEIYLSNRPMSDMADIYLFFASAILTLSKLICLHVHREKIAKNLRSYFGERIDSNDAPLLGIMESHVKIYKYQFILYNSVAYIGTTFFLLRIILINALQEPDENFEWNLICQTSFFSRDFVDRYSSVILGVQYVQMLYLCTSGSLTDCFFFGLVIHLCAQLDALNVQWRRIEQADDTDRRARVTRLVDRHRKLVDLGENLEASFNSVVLVQLTISIILICMSGFSVLVGLLESDYVRILVSTNCISWMITESFIYGYASDYLINQSEEIGRSVYAIGWHAADRRTRADLVFVMMRAQKPLSITAGKFFRVTRNTIIQLLKTTASYLSVLRLTLELSK